MISPTIEDALALPLPFACAFMAVFGAVIGSFLNVVIHRLPREQSIVFPKSTCPSCRAPIRAYDNIPILSFLILRGRCRKCGAKISARYPAVEALVALLFAAVTWHDGLSFALPFDLAFTAAVVALIFIDAEHMILPNAITYPGILFALITRVAVPYLAGASHFDDLPQLQSLLPPQYPLWLVSLIGAAIGALAGGGSLWLMGFLWEKLRGVEAMGLGDVKMMFMVGAFLGWRLTILTILLAAFTGSLAGIAMMIRRGSRNLQMMLPFGIFLGIGSIISLLIGTRIIDWYASQFH
ncbi:MAG TPA: prepilin peptidase [Pyrinomonadaceae bacterium]|nr:prepilin peptidase [Pyrinomonadaceae bacterium]